METAAILQLLAVAVVVAVTSGLLLLPKLLAWLLSALFDCKVDVGGLDLLRRQAERVTVQTRQGPVHVGLVHICRNTDPVGSAVTKRFRLSLHLQKVQVALHQYHSQGLPQEQGEDRKARKSPYSGLFRKLNSVLSVVSVSVVDLDVILRSQDRELELSAREVTLSSGSVDLGEDRVSVAVASLKKRLKVNGDVFAAGVEVQSVSAVLEESSVSLELSQVDAHVSNAFLIYVQNIVKSRPAPDPKASVEAPSPRMTWPKLSVNGTGVLISCKELASLQVFNFQMLSLPLKTTTRLSVERVELRRLASGHAGLFCSLLNLDVSLLPDGRSLSFSQFYVHSSELLQLPLLDQCAVPTGYTLAIHTVVARSEGDTALCSITEIDLAGDCAESRTLMVQELSLGFGPSFGISQILAYDGIFHPSREDVRSAFILSAQLPKVASSFANVFLGPSLKTSSKSTSRSTVTLQLHRFDLFLPAARKYQFVDLCVTTSKLTAVLNPSASSWSLDAKSISLEDRGSDSLRPLVVFERSVHVASAGKDSTRVWTRGSVAVYWHLYWQQWLFEAMNMCTELKAAHCEEKEEAAPKDDRAESAPRLLEIDVSSKILLEVPMQDHALHVAVEAGRLALQGPGNWCVQATSVAVGVDQEPRVIAVQELQLRSKPNQSENRIDPDFEAADKSNTCIQVCMLSCEVSCPYLMDLHAVFSGELVAIFKWIKTQFKSGKKREQKTAPDIIFYLKSLVLELPDDPFECRLRDNYELLEDEHLESEKRHKCLDAKIEELRKSRIVLPSAKIEELYASLGRKNAEIYVQRSMTLQQKGSRRTRLLKASFNTIKFCVLADATMTGDTPSVQFMKNVEPESWCGDVQFDTIHYRWIRFECKSVLVQLRDFPQPFLLLKHVLLWGKCVLAEQAAHSRSVRQQILKIKHPDFSDVVLRRSLHSLKMYQDFAMDMESFQFSHGPCWEPVLAQVNMAVNYVTGVRSKDPSPPLAWWDKMRYVMHGHLLWSMKTFKLFLHTSLDPYNTTEEIELNLANAIFKIHHSLQLKCTADSLDLFVRTDSKYDDCRLLHIPKFGFCCDFYWNCTGNAMDHHSVLLCAEEHIPEFSSNSEHDSYRGFRSQNVNVRLNLETLKCKTRGATAAFTQVYMYSSTIRWMESLKWLFSGTARPIRKGALFNTQKIKKQSFFRHINQVDISYFLQKIKIDYWTSFSATRGILVIVERGFALAGKYTLKLEESNDGLIHRPRTKWLTDFTNCELSSMELWLECAMLTQEERNLAKYFFLSVDNIQYNKAKDCANSSSSAAHCLTVNGARAAWTISNRDLLIGLYESWRRAHIMREQLSSEKLKVFSYHEAGGGGVGGGEVQSPPLVTVKESLDDLLLSPVHSWSGEELLESLDCTTVYSNEKGETSEAKELEAMLACKKDDVVRRDWLIKFVNCQVLLKGSETEGYVILSAHKAEAVRNMHRPVWNEETLLSKSSWSGSLESMQYFATVAPSSDQDILWLSQDTIEEGKDMTAMETLSLETSGSGAVGGVIGHLQRIVSKCRCEFYVVTYGDESLEGTADQIPKKPEGGLWLTERQDYVNSLALIHHDLNVCTNSLQYAMVLDVLNNLLLYVDPTRRSRTENYLRMKYKLMLSNLEDQRKPIFQLQSGIRQLICQLRTREKVLHNTASISSAGKSSSIECVEAEIQALKEQVTLKSEELDLRIRCFQDFQLSQNQKQVFHSSLGKAEIRERSDIFFSHAQWRLTENDGQLGIADAAITNFSYSRIIMKDDSMEHLVEMGYIYVKNLLRSQAYVDVILPTELQNIPLDRQRTLRVFCRERPPVNGISLKDHFEINLVPLTIGITQSFFRKIVAFCFPDKNTEASGSDHGASKDRKKRVKEIKKKNSNFYVSSPLNKDDIEEMKDRAQRNRHFVYIKIPEVPICVSFKGEKEKNKILDVANFLLHVPTIEYHNMTWTWLDFLLEVKNRTKDSLISQAIKQKLSIRSTSNNDLAKKSSQDDAYKAKLLLGNNLLAPKRK